MIEEETSFQAGFEFEPILRLLSKQIYETPLAFIRENVQNAVDAVRIQAHRDGVLPQDDRYRIDIAVEGKTITVKDNGNGMSPSDLKNSFWKIGASGKRTPEALAAGCVGTFGIGGFANFGVCDVLEIDSKTEEADHGIRTRLFKRDIREAGPGGPPVSVERSDAASPRGTLVIGQLLDDPNEGELKQYLLDFVRFVPVAVYFDGEKLPQTKFLDVEDRDNYVSVSPDSEEWRDGDLVLSGRLFEDRGHALAINVEGMAVKGEPTNLVGFLRFENGPISVFKHGFKLCATQIGSTIGVSGRLDCDRFTPTAGRDSLDSTTMNLLARIVALLEKVAIEAILKSPERIAQHTRIFRYVLSNGLVGQMDKVIVRLADGSERSLGDIRDRAQKKDIGVFFGLAQKQALHQIMQARGHLVVLLASDRNRQRAERQYLEEYCAAKPFDGVIDCSEIYEDLNRFEKIFLSELEMTIERSYEIEKFSLITGRLTEDIPVFLREKGAGKPLEILVDVRHPEIAKLEALGYTNILYSLIAKFCQEYLGPSLKKWSPRFFGDGSLNLGLLSRRRSELWILVRDDIGEISKGGQRQIVTRSDIQRVDVTGGEGEAEPSSQKPNPRLLHIIDTTGTTNLAGYYIRVPDTAFRAYGDLLQSCESRGLVWHGDKITFMASDTVSAAFRYEIRLDELVVVAENGDKRAEGAIELLRPLQEIFDGIYFPIPSSLEPFLVPTGDEEIRLELDCDWIDMRTAMHWLPRGGLKEASN